MSVTTLQAIMLWFIAAGVLGFIFMDYVRFKVHLLSIRNITLFGFVVYQLLSPSYTLLSNRPDTFRIDDLAGSGWKFIFMAVLFLLVFFVSYGRGWGVKKLAHRVPIYKRELSENSMVLIAVVCTLLTAVMRFTSPESIPALYNIMFFSSVAFTTLSTGLVTWWWMQRQFNFARSSVAFITIGANVLMMMTGAFSRRPVISITLMFVWAVYYSRSRFNPSRVKVVTTLMVAAIPLIVLASLLTSARHQGLRDQGATEVVKYVFSEGRIGEGMADLLGGQLVGEASLWCIEAFPDHYERDHLFSLRYYFLSNIPRKLWPEKPWGLSANLADLADLQGVNQNRAKGDRGVTLPPGVVGYAAAEGGIYALVIYALVFGLSIRFLDELVTIHPYRLAVVLPLAASLGNFLGVLRGDMSLFAVGATWAIIVSFILLAIATALLGRHTYHASDPSIRQAYP